MLARIMSTWSQIRASLWALPFTIVIAAASLAILATHIQLSSQNDPVWYLYSGSAKQAPQFLSSLVGAMITMATLVISITMVVLSLAAQQLGPRLIQSFMSDRVTQSALGLYIGTSIYLLIVLRNVYGADDAAPNLAVTIGTTLVILSMITLPVFVHHLARSIIADNIIERVGAALDIAAERLLPLQTPESASQVAVDRTNGSALVLPAGGYVQAIDFDQLVSAAAKANGVVKLAVRAGHHGIPGGTYGWVNPASARSKELERVFASSLILGSVRTSYQDLEFSVRQLVEISLRALSPGVNDPYTALAAIDRLARSIAVIMQRGAAQSLWCDQDGFVRVTAPAVTFEGLVDAALTQIRQVASSHPAILIRLAENIGQLLLLATPEHARVLLKHVTLVEAAGRRNIPDASDLNDLEERIAHARSCARDESQGN
jgi:uncharacterized membrane protein